MELYGSLLAVVVASLRKPATRRRSLWADPPPATAVTKTVRREATAKLMAQVERLLSDEFNRRWTTSVLATRLGVSPKTILRLFRAVYGQSPHEYLTSVRLGQALRALAEDEAKVEAIASRSVIGARRTCTARSERERGARSRSGRGVPESAL